jgi:hypothetical protein
LSVWSLRHIVWEWAYSLTENLADAGELAQEGMTRAIDPKESPWDPEKQPSLVLHVGSLMNSLAANRRRGEKRHKSVSYKPKLDARVDPDPTPEEQAERVEDLARLQGWMNDLLARLAGDTIALGKIKLMREGIDDAAEQAARLGCTTKDVYRANERIAYHVGLVKKASRAPGGRPQGQP